MPARANDLPVDPLFIVGVGASAGGLDALIKFVAVLPDDVHLAVIIAQHVSPDHKSKMVELLARHTSWPVVVAEDQAEVYGRLVYVTPPDCEITIAQRKITLAKKRRTVRAVPSIDGFLTSLAEDQQTQAIAVILSGTGQDGTQGIAAIQSHGGYVLAQQPEEAQHRDMPDAAILSGHVNEVVSVDQIGDQLVGYVKNQRRDELKGSPETSLQGILRLLTNKFGTDFSKYKSSTIERRIKKRMEALSLATIDDYLYCIQKDKEELDRLFETVLIGVTEFFRDKPAYGTLREYVKKVVELKRPGETIRVWSVGCATGEEPYSVAILIAEALGKNLKNHTVQVFATDIDENALAAGRQGFYSDDQMKNLSKEQIQEYFTQKNHGYEIKKSIRQWVLFSKHDISRDPPFVRLDFITCRNLLIYFDNELQRKVIPVFHYALHPEGYLLLGKSENIVQLPDLFINENTKQKLFRKKTDVSLNALKFNNLQQTQLIHKPQKKPSLAELSLKELASEILIQTFEHPFVVINETLEVVHIRGKLQPYVDLEEGSLNANVLKIICGALHMELRTTFAKAKRESTPCKSNIVRFQTYDQEHLVRLVINPFPFQRNDTDYYLVIFERVDALEQYPFSVNELELNNDENRNAVRAIELEHELAATREHLQTFTEELETSKMELQSLNEELQLANEELKSSNEELETSNEELQAANEELHTANSELAISNVNLIEKETELLRTKDDLKTNQDRFRLALDNSQIILFYQDTKLRYTWQYNNYPGSTNEDILGKSDYKLLGSEHQELIAAKERVLAMVENEHLVVKIDDVSYDTTIKPVLHEGQVVGIKGIAIDISERVKALQTVEENRAVIQNIIDNSVDCIIAVDTNYRILAVNRVQRRETRALFDIELEVGENMLTLMEDFPDPQARTRTLFSKALQGETIQKEQYQTVRSKEIGSLCYYDLSISPIRKPDGEIMGAVLVSREVTHKVIAERQIKSIIEQSANLTGEDFFRNLTKQIADLFQVKYIYLGMLDQEAEQVHTCALRKSGKLSQNFSYGLQDSPCHAVASNGETHHVEHVNQQFPDDPKLQRWKAESYLGIPVSSPLDGETLAILVMMDERSLPELSNATYVLNILTLRAGAEIERMRAEKKYREKEEQIRNITENIADVIYESVEPVQGDSYFRYVSRAISDIYELQSEEVLNDIRGIFNVIHPEDLPDLLQLRDETLRGKVRTLSFEGRVIGALSGKIRWVIITGKIERQSNRDVVWYGTITNITTLKQTQEELKEAKEQAEQAARAKEDFLATMSHEIRTPLNAIVGLSNLLLSQNPQPQQLKNLQALRFSSENLMSLINDILDFSKIEAGKIALERTPFNLTMLLANLRQAHQQAALKNNNRLDLYQEDGVPYKVVGDPGKLSQILNNLLSNAIKFTKDGEVKLHVSSEPAEGEKINITFSVEDTGIGISPGKLDTIFEKFTQADSSTRRHYGGTGLGLTITRLLIELMGSKIQVESEEGKGARFYFSLPFALAAEEHDVASEEPIHLSSADYKSEVRVLIVEDVAVNRMILQQYFQRWGKIIADEATNGEEAVEKATKNTYDLILMDIRMPIMDGYEATRRIRALPGKKKLTPIIALTADTTKHVEENGTLHFTEVLLKPFDPEILKDKIARCVNMPPASRSSSQPTVVAEQEGAPLAENELKVDFAYAEKPFDHPDQLEKFYQLTLQAFSEYQKTYATAMAQRNANQLHHLAHKMKTSLTMFKLNSLYQQLRLDAELLSDEDPAAIQSAAEHTHSLIIELSRQIQVRRQTLEESKQ